MGIPKGIKVPLPEVRKAVHSKIVKLDAKLESQINDYVALHVLGKKPSNESWAALFFTRLYYVNKRALL